MISGVYVVIGVSSIVVEVGYAMMRWSLGGNCLLVRSMSLHNHSHCGVDDEDGKLQKRRCEIGWCIGCDLKVVASSYFDFIGFDSSLERHSAI